MYIAIKSKQTIIIKKLKFKKEVGIDYIYKKVRILKTKLAIKELTRVI